MALSRMFWMNEPFFHEVWGTSRPPDITSGHDVHVLLGTTSLDLRPGIAFYDPALNRSWAWGGSYIAARLPADGLRFVPRFEVQARVGHRIDGHGVQVDEETGAVTAVAPAGALRLRNFILEVTATIKDPPESEGRVLDPIRIRIHLHDELVRWWLTPSPLTVHRGSPGQRLSVLAELSTAGQPDPPQVADLSRLVGITWSSTSPDLTFTHGAIDSATIGTATVTATLPASWGGSTASADVEVIEGWHERPAAATLLAGPGLDRLMEIPNLLLIPEGFTAAQEGDWDQLVTRLIEEIKGGRVYRPYDLFLTSDSINVWSVFLPSREPGSSFLSEVRVDPVTDSTALVAAIMPTPLIFPRPGDAWDLLRLFARAGLPVRSDQGATAASHADKIVEWHGLYGAAEVPEASATPALYDLWRTWANRTLVDERDTVLNLAYGSRPRAERANDARFPDFHPLRTSFKELQKFVGRLTDGPGGPLIGHAFVSDGRPGTGKDAGRVAVLVAGGRHGGYRQQILAASLHQDRKVNLERIEPGFRHRSVPYPIPTVSSSFWDSGPGVTPESRGVVVHEISHSFVLEDEYATFTHEPLPASRLPGLLGVGNVQPAGELVAAGADPVSDRPLLGDNLRWRWPRIARAAVLTEVPIQSSSDEFILSLRRGQKRRFRNGDIVMLRQRPLLKYPPPGGPGTLVPAKVSVPLEVVSDAQVEEQIIVRTSDPAFVPAEFPADPPHESIVFIAVPAPAYAAAEGAVHAELVPHLVRAHITSTGRPLNRTSAETCAALLSDDDRARLANVPADVNPFWVREWVGAFDGGDEYACGIFHPSNHCMMRVPTDVTGTFCPVCRYLLVDAIDPSLHGEVDDAYRPFYVEPAS